MCVNILLHADNVNIREVEQAAGLQRHVSRDGATYEEVTPQHLDIEKIEREIEWVKGFCKLTFCFDSVNEA